MAKKTVELIMKVADASREGLNKFRASVAETRAKLNVGGEKGLIGNVNKQVEDLAKVSKAVGFIAIGASGVTIAIRGWKAASAAFSGDLERQEKAMSDLAESAKQLPLGLGQVFGVGQQLRELWTGEQKAIEEAEAATKRLNEQTAKRAKSLAAVKKIQEDIAKETRASEKVIDAALFGDTRMGKVDAVNKEFDQRINEQKARIEALKNELTNAGNRDAENSDVVKQARAQLDVTEKERRVALDKAKKEADELTQKRIEEANKESEARTKVLEEYEKRRAESAAKEAEVDKELNAQTNASAKRSGAMQIEILRALGKEREAEKAAIMESYEDQVMAAQQAAERIMENAAATAAQRAEAERILAESLSDAEDQRAFKLGQLATKQPQAPGALAMRESRFLTGASDQKTQTPEQKSLDELVAIGKAQLKNEERRNQVAANARSLEVVIR